MIEAIVPWVIAILMVVIPATLGQWRYNVTHKLTPYQVGENDIVVAYNPKQALELLVEYCDYEAGDWEDFEVEDISYKLDVMILDEEGAVIETLRDCIKRISAPEYLYGWE
jgi:hypothetical protein